MKSVIRKIHAHGLCWGLFFLLGYCLPTTTSAHDPLILAIHPYLPFAELQDRFTPLADYLGNQLGRNVVVRIGRNYQDHMGHVGRNEVDFAFMGPAQYVTLIDKFGEKPLLARLEINGKPVFHGKIITAKDSPIATLAALKGKRFAFGDPESTMSHLVPRFMLLDEPFAGVDPIAVNEIKKIVGHLRERRIGVLITDHNVRETLDICDRAYIINEGEVLAHGVPQMLLNNPDVREVYLGHDFQM